MERSTTDVPPPPTANPFQYEREWEKAKDQSVDTQGSRNARNRVRLIAVIELMFVFFVWITIIIVASAGGFRSLDYISLLLAIPHTVTPIFILFISIFDDPKWVPPSWILVIGAIICDIIAIAVYINDMVLCYTGNDGNACVAYTVQDFFFAAFGLALLILGIVQLVFLIIFYRELRRKIAKTIYRNNPAFWSAVQRAKFTSNPSTVGTELREITTLPQNPINDFGIPSDSEPLVVINDQLAGYSPLPTSSDPQTMTPLAPLTNRGSLLVEDDEDGAEYDDTEGDDDEEMGDMTRPRLRTAAAATLAPTTPAAILPYIDVNRMQQENQDGFMGMLWGIVTGSMPVDTTNIVTATKRSKQQKNSDEKES